MTTYAYTCVDRFLKYVTHDTQSDPDSDSFPSTSKQKDFAEILVNDLLEIGLKDVTLDEWGYVMGTLPGNSEKECHTIGLIAHMDTSPDVSGKDVKPIIHRNYQGGSISLGDSGIVILADETPDLKNHIGHDIITSDGTTLLGADNKAGIAEIFDVLYFFVQHPEIKHGDIRVAITPDEEIGKGADHFDVKTFAADYAYTIDGETVGEVEDETFCADSVTLTLTGVNVHPGYAKNKMVNSIKAASAILEALPQDSMSPETTADRQGYLHPHFISGNEEQTTVKFLVRDFTVDGLKEKETLLRQICDKVLSSQPKADYSFKVTEYYRNMKYKLDEEPRVVDYALEAVKRAGITPRRHAIRGGTDGARLSYMGLLTPNIFTGGHNFHSKEEYIAVQDMQKAVDVIVNVVKIWHEKGRA